MLRTKGKGAAVLRSLLALAVAASLRPALVLAGEPSASLEPEQVRVVQRALNEHGQKVKVTGQLFEKTGIIKVEKIEAAN